MRERWWLGFLPFKEGGASIRLTFAFPTSPTPHPHTHAHSAPLLLFSTTILYYHNAWVVCACSCVHHAPICRLPPCFRNSIEQSKKTGSGNDTLFLAEIMAYQGKYQEAAKLFAKAGSLEKYVPSCPVFSPLYHCARLSPTRTPHRPPPSPTHCHVVMFV